MHIRKGDQVVVLAGPQKGQRGRVLRVLSKKQRVLVEGVNMIRKHTRPSTRNQQGGIVEREAPIHISNVRPWCDTANAPSQIIMKRLADGTRVRAFKVNGETLND